METCIRFADENAAQQPVTSMLANSPPPAKDKPSGGGQGKPGGKPGGQAGKPGASALATTNGTSTGLCLHHCLKGSCFKKSAFCQAHQEDAHPPARAGHGILPSELAAWPSCGKPDCTYGLQCIFKHGDGTEQVAAKHGRLSTSRTQHAAAPSAAPPAATSLVASAHTGGDLPASFTTAQLGALLTDLRTELRTSNRIYQQHASANAPTQLGPPGPLPSNNPWATWL